MPTARTGRSVYSIVTAEATIYRASPRCMGFAAYAPLLMVAARQQTQPRGGVPSPPAEPTVALRSLLGDEVGVDAEYSGSPPRTPGVAHRAVACKARQTHRLRQKAPCNGIQSVISAAGRSWPPVPHLLNE